MTSIDSGPRFLPRSALLSRGMCSLSPAKFLKFPNRLTWQVLMVRLSQTCLTYSRPEAGIQCCNLPARGQGATGCTRAGGQRISDPASGYEETWEDWTVDTKIRKEVVDSISSLIFDMVPFGSLTQNHGLPPPRAMLAQFRAQVVVTENDNDEGCISVTVLITRPRARSTAGTQGPEGGSTVRMFLMRNLFSRVRYGCT